MSSRPNNDEDEQEKAFQCGFSRFLKNYDPTVLNSETNSPSGPRLSNESSRNQNGSGNSLKHKISYNATKSKDSEVTNETNLQKQQTSLDTVESKDSKVTNENERTKNNEKSSRLTLDPGTGKNLYSKSNNGQDEQEKEPEHEPMTFHEHMCDAISSSGPRLSIESSSNQNGSGNSSKLQISYKATKSKDSEVITSFI